MTEKKYACEGCIVNDCLKQMYPDEMWRYHCPRYDGDKDCEGIR